MGDCLVGEEAGGWRLSEESLEEWSEPAAFESLRGDFWIVRMDESFVGRANDCSKGFGSKSKLLRFVLGGGGGGRDLGEPSVSL